MVMQRGRRRSPPPDRKPFEIYESGKDRRYKLLYGRTRRRQRHRRHQCKDTIRNRRNRDGGLLSLTGTKRNQTIRNFPDGCPTCCPTTCCYCPKEILPNYLIVRVTSVLDEYRDPIGLYKNHNWRYIKRWPTDTPADHGIWIERCHDFLLLLRSYSSDYHARSRAGCIRDFYERFSTVSGV
jgi:hypothetical protein